MTNKNPKVYLGDSVYAQLDQGVLKLTTENGITASNTIYLELDTYKALLQFVDSLKEKKTEKKQNARR